MPADRPARRPLTRRSALKALTLPCLAGLGTAACGAGGQTVQVAVIWTGWELRQFKQVMDEFSRTKNIGYQLLSMGDDTGAFLGNEVTAAAQPDVALVSAPGLVQSNSMRLATVPWPAGDAPSWQQQNWLGQGDSQYGVWFKAAYQSMVWHTDDLNVPDGGWDWDTWVHQCKRLAASGQAPLSIGAADGWVLAAWFANVLLSIDPATYKALARKYANAPYPGNGPTWKHPSVREALGRLATVWQIEGAFPGGAERALVTQFDQSVLDVFASRRAAMVVGADYFWPIIIQSARFPSGKVRWFPFPSMPGEHIPAVVGGDAAVLFRRSGGGPGETLINWLGTAEAASIWAQAGGYLSINEQVTESYYRYPPTMNTEKLIGYVQNRSPGGSAAFDFDMADLLGGPLGGGDGEGTWNIFTDFFTEVAVRRSPVPDAIDAAVAALDSGSSGA